MMRVEMIIFNTSISMGWNCVSDRNWLESMGAKVANQGIGGVEGQVSQRVFVPARSRELGIGCFLFKYEFVSVI